MARRTQKKSDNQATGRQPDKSETVWANLRLTSDDAPYIQEEATDLPALCVRLAAVFLQGADFSIRYNPVRGNYSAFIISAVIPDNNKRIGLSAFGPDIAISLSAVLYKFDLYQQDPSKFASGSQSLGFG